MLANCAASVHGDVFLEGAVAALLGGAAAGASEWLDELVRREVVTRLTLSRLGAFEEARTQERAAADAFLVSGNRRLDGASLVR